MSSRRYAILGTGALGGFYGARLQKAGLDVHFLLHRDYDWVRHSGLVVESPEGNFSLPQVNAYADVQAMPPCDVVVVALKTTQNHLLPQLLPPLLHEHNWVLVLQNGLGIEPEVAKIVGGDRVMGGLCFICSNKVGPGHIRHLDYSAITLGDYAPNYHPCGITERMQQVKQDFEQANIPIQLSEDLLLARWQKLVWNIPFNGLSVVLDATTTEMMASPPIRTLATELMQEVVAGAKACHKALPDDAIAKMLDNTAKMKPYKTSMKLDYEAGNPLEIEAIFGNPLRLATQAGASLPRMTLLYQQLQFLESRKIVLSVKC
ncbi:putative 2-dehydropantoate 2-reductase [Desertifilum sp. FACHB-1129]|uniref:2-dehydropantoate 2-reductase n=1 Tax=Desertifilum tharense IPPAS B-1220 TaxID=1781255 RepID=A0A1E5QKQ4_9CYAN|nr:MULTISPECIES: putative 2-dehydropantoate 2-reductase [Desertifilum]MDA0210223.1 putative 2-dehydropantoate 2-reductase [Cyanobacteria bacterium FC1]MBD2310169.1 putative 2-dehydropantoate 2-reductase [Desertifilum sp. FACHB-1129]MBD2322544.1 putative 2-dehydropantoate 2-reductase [Desertifilum sp. FACHB-866]MBD2334597.1 putative 2-dehydropantoate 2-reductase [Desertifilum sp. FACHB-868]OEJ75262.1 2-dehydropantoate 2-reductase [Desertifilum tharense IPPAS B-1220]